LSGDLNGVVIPVFPCSCSESWVAHG
jgi:hypothetical protein